MKYVWVAEYLKNRRWHYIGAQPKMIDAQNLCTAYRLSNEEGFSKARIRKFMFAGEPKKCTN